MKHSTIFSFLTRFFLLLLSHKINQKKKQESDPTVTNQKRRSSREKSQHAIEKIWWRFESYAYLFISMLVAVKAIKVQTSTFPIQHPNICRASVCIEANITWKSFFSRSKISGKYKQSKSTHTKKRTSQTQMQRKKEEEKKILLAIRSEMLAFNSQHSNHHSTVNQFTLQLFVLHYYYSDASHRWEPLI